MPWLKVDDCADQAPALLALARNQREADLLFGIHCSLLVYCAKHLTDGFLPALVVRNHLRGQLLEKFTGGPAPILHTPDHDCECLDGRAWPSTMAYALHSYLIWNPTAAEHDVRKAKRAELDDRELLALVRDRDQDLCRYCGQRTVYADRRSGRGLVFDHVDPDVANGAANLVVACRSCNSRKGNRTPAGAGMNLLPEPQEMSTEPRTDLQSGAAIASGVDAGWSTSGPQLQPAPGHDAHFPDAGAPTSRSTNPATNRPINGSTTDTTNRSTNRSGSGLTTPRVGRDGTGRVDAGWAGPAGERDQVGPAPPRRSSAYPNPYRRSGITGPDPADHAGLPRGPPRARGTVRPHHPTDPKVHPCLNLSTRSRTPT